MLRNYVTISILTFYLSSSVAFVNTLKCRDDASPTVLLSPINFIVTLDFDTGFSHSESFGLNDQDDGLPLRCPSILSKERYILSRFIILENCLFEIFITPTLLVVAKLKFNKYFFHELNQIFKLESIIHYIL